MEFLDFFNIWCLRSENPGWGRGGEGGDKVLNPNLSTMWEVYCSVEKELPQPQTVFAWGL
jgi:hypothetical protein